MTPRAHHYCQRRFGQWEPVLTWEEFKAWGDATEHLPPAEKEAVLREGLTYFTTRPAPRN